MSLLKNLFSGGIGPAAAAADPAAIITAVGDGLAKNPELAKSIGLTVEGLGKDAGDLAKQLSPAALEVVSDLLKKTTDVTLGAAAEILKNPGAYAGESAEKILDVSLHASKNSLTAAGYKVEEAELEVQLQGAKSSISDIQQKRKTATAEAYAARQEGRLESQEKQISQSARGFTAFKKFISTERGRTKRYKSNSQLIRRLQSQQSREPNNQDLQNQINILQKQNAELLRMGIRGAAEGESTLGGFTSTVGGLTSTVGGLTSTVGGVSNILGSGMLRSKFQGGLGRLFPNFNLDFAKVVVLVLFLVASAIWLSANFRDNFLNPTTARNVAIGTGLFYLLLNTSLFNKDGKRLFLVF